MSSLPERVYRIFVSSTFGGLRPLRGQAIFAIREYGHLSTSFEQILPDDLPSQQVLLPCIQNSDLVIAIIDECFGSRVADGRSFVQWEVETAWNHDVPVLPFIRREFSINSLGGMPADLSDQFAFINALRANKLLQVFDGDGDFSIKLDRMLAAIDKKVRSPAGYVLESVARDRVAGLEQTIGAQKVQIRELEETVSALERRRAIDIGQQDVVVTTMDALAQITVHRAALARKNYDIQEVIMAHDRELHKILEALSHRWGNYPILLEIASMSVQRLSDTLRSLTSPSGYQANSYDELLDVIELLFGATLKKLQATSIISDRPGLSVYKEYWADPKIGQRFEEKNRRFLAAGGCIERIYICDSFDDAVLSPWFDANVLRQVEDGATITLVEIDPAASYEDFGVYSHAGDTEGETRYILVAPREYNATSDVLNTNLKCVGAGEFDEKFAQLWGRAPEPIRFFDLGTPPAVIEDAGRGSLSDLFGKSIVLRNLKRLDGISLAGGTPGFVRKYEPVYAEAVGRHIEQCFKGTKSVLYFGDTFENDGRLMRNLQRSGWNLYGFICNPQVPNPKPFVFADIFYTRQWDAATEFLSWVADRVDLGSTLAIFDIDQTLWAPRGLNEAAISASRKNAIAAIMNSYFPENERFRKKAVRAANLVYQVVCREEYYDLTLDNEDYKAAITLLMALGFYDDGFKGGEGLPLFDLDGDKDQDFCAVSVLNLYLPRKRGAVERPIDRFINCAIRNLWSARRKGAGARYGLDLDVVEADLEGLAANMEAGVPAPFQRFRKQELKEAMMMVDAASPHAGLTINKGMWDMARVLKCGGASLLALSDRPDEATYNDQHSLLHAELLIHGHDLECRLGEAATGARSV